ncbi:SH3 domain containing protein Dlish [Dissostichus eleginoides]|uniref:SH3 domain containing protein Dlish n=1 Tax=Dissostichus eleginoides TaxID=100907 RepID=A0AAD9B0M4_DISEL|nr:SH3 domain containing protein Dlish [Dissostichus eleginoides]
MVVVSDHRAGLQRDLDLRRGDQVLVLFREENSCFGRRSDGQEGYFPPACVEPLQVGGASCRATPPLLRRGSVPAVRTPPCGCSSGHGTPKQLKKILLKPEGGGAEGGGQSSPSLLHRVLARSRRMSCPHLPHLPLRPPDHGSINTTFQAD